jgi:hypothetical protein
MYSYNKPKEYAMKLSYLISLFLFVPLHNAVGVVSKGSDRFSTEGRTGPRGDLSRLCDFSFFQTAILNEDIEEALRSFEGFKDLQCIARRIESLELCLAVLGDAEHNREKREFIQKVIEAVHAREPHLKFVLQRNSSLFKAAVH